MVEVFKTDVENPVQVGMLLHHIHTAFTHYKANFDLDDCDKILRVKSFSGEIKADSLVDLLQDFGFQAEVLADECTAALNNLSAN